MPKKHLICIVGPTAVGKTVVGIKLAQAFNTEIVSADSRQFYQEMEIGTAKPTKSELESVPHHFINSLSIRDSYDVGVYEREALAKLERIYKKHDLAILVGGSGLFVNALCNGLDEFPEVKPEIREKLIMELESAGLGSLNRELQRSDPAYFDVVDHRNPQRVIRALEVIRSTGKSFTHFRKKKPKVRPFDVITVGLELDRQLLYQRIDNRMDEMVASGLFSEAKGLLEFKKTNALQTVGYREIFGFLDGDYDRDEAIRLLKRNSRRYAKRQLTWFKRDSSTTWFDPRNWSEILIHVNEKIRTA